ncbi:uncharacterized protein LOC128877530 [Hylaeus volcanicus]|uniref:uncharacterized protein LOC128877530 n=1 Tax=Hylaeus volcanicus TaxID=313075 RepID=UPI0023B8218C|nr:uncharacterized protein LOC128877530 [Hylaeus volcanicus]
MSRGPLVFLAIIAFVALPLETTTQTELTTPKPETTIQTESTTTTPEANNTGLRSRRSILNRFAGIDTLEDGTKYYCFEKSEDNTTTRGCTSNEHLCGDNKDCKLCDTDRCNSATSTAVYVSMMVSLLVVLFVAK